MPTGPSLAKLPRFLPMICAALGAACVARGPQAVAAAEPTTALGVIERAQQAFESVTDYQCLVQWYGPEDGKMTHAVYRVWFKKPHMFRLRVIHGSHHGSEIVETPEGHFYGRAGGLLKSFSIRLKPNDDRLRDSRGGFVTDLVWGKLYRDFRAHAGLPGAKTSLLPHRAPDEPFDAVVVYPQRGTTIRTRYRVDPRIWEVVETEDQENGVQTGKLDFQEIRTNTGLPDRFFTF